MADFPTFPEFDEVEAPPTANWWDFPINTVDRALEILQDRAVYIQSVNEEGQKLRELLAWVEEQHKQEVERIYEIYPQAKFKPSYEQSLLLNCWWCGVTFPICFSANRIGKTACFVFNGILWIFPNNPDWVCFKPYTDHLGREVHVLQRPAIEKVNELQRLLADRPELSGDPMWPYYDVKSGNAAKFATLQKLRPDLFTTAWPAAPVTRGGTIWLGAPDNKYHKEIILKLWRRMLPQPSIQQWSDTDLNFTISTLETGNPKPITVNFSCKSYESEDTKWSGDAVLGIILTEGLEPATLDEIKQRIIETGFISWDYTPYEAANVGKKSALAKKVYEKKEELPLVPHVFVGFSARNAPDHILPAQKRADLIRMWTGKKQGEARLDGNFFTTSPAILSKLDRPFHCLNWSREELFARFPNGQLYRSIDPGYDHPTSCGWFLLSPQNVWFCYRYLTRSGMSIAERCKVIIEMSGNLQAKRYIGKRPEDFIQFECHPFPESEVYNGTVMDYHNFKIDETSGKPLQTRYLDAGLPVIPSATIGDADRAQEIDKLLDKVPYYTHPVFGSTPSARLFFLINEPGVGDALDQMESLFWERYKSGDQKGMPKDEVPQQGDDELDVLGQIAASPYRWAPYRPKRVDMPDNSLIEERFATLQNFAQMEKQAQNFAMPMVARFGS
jgi:hypothetical protein